MTEKPASNSGPWNKEAEASAEEASAGGTSPQTDKGTSVRKPSTVERRARVVRVRTELQGSQTSNEAQSFSSLLNQQKDRLQDSVPEKAKSDAELPAMLAQPAPPAATAGEQATTPEQEGLKPTGQTSPDKLTESTDWPSRADTHRQPAQSTNPYLILLAAVMLFAIIVLAMPFLWPQKQISQKTSGQDGSPITTSPTRESEPSAAVDQSPATAPVESPSQAPFILPPAAPPATTSPTGTANEGQPGGLTDTANKEQPGGL